MSVDKGPGIEDVSRALADGTSSTRSMGVGLGAIQRLSDAFDLYSIPGSGTVISAEFWPENRKGSGVPLPCRWKSALCPNRFARKLRVAMDGESVGPRILLS